MFGLLPYNLSCNVGWYDITVFLYNPLAREADANGHDEHDDESDKCTDEDRRIHAEVCRHIHFVLR